MSKLLNYIAILSTILIGAHLLGLITDTGSSTLLSWLVSPEELISSGVFSSLTNVLTLLGVGATAVTIGLIISQRYDLAALVGLASLLFLVGWDIIAIYTSLKDINPDFALLLCSPLLLIYLLTVIEWWRGTG